MKDIFRKKDVEKTLSERVNALEKEDVDGIREFFADCFGLQAGYHTEEEPYILTFDSACFTFRKKRNFDKAVKFLFDKLVEKTYFE